MCCVLYRVQRIRIYIMYTYYIYIYSALTTTVFVSANNFFTVNNLHPICPVHTHAYPFRLLLFPSYNNRNSMYK